MADYDDIVTNQQILDIANGIRKVTRTTDSMTILQMPERLLDVRVIETRRISVELNSPAPLLIGTYDESVKHLFIILPVTEQDAQTLNKTKPALEISTLSGEIALHYQTPTAGTINLLLIDCLLPDNEETQGILVPQLTYLELDRLDSRIDETAANLSTLAGEVSALDGAVNDLSSDLAQEIADREAADTDLLSSIQLESARAQAAEANLQTEIDTEKQRAETQEGILSDAINAETAQRIAADNALSLRTAEIEQKIPPQATVENKLADKEFVNSSITHMAARYVTPTPEATSVWTSFAALNNGPWYHNGSAYMPTQHDYAIYTEADGSQWRATYEGGQWAKQFKINDTPFTAAQIAALNSNITAALVDKLAGIEPGAQVNVQSDWAETDTESDAFIKNKPTAMPADGGNADTVDGKHASEFATAEQGLKADNAVPKTRKINGKALSADITLTPADIGAATAAQGTKADNAVPNTRKVNGKMLSTDITLTPSDIGAATAEQGAKADTALQTETDPTVPDWAKQPTKPVYSFIEINDKPTTIVGYGITDTYTKTEVDNKLASVFEYKGVKATYSDLPTTGNRIGDVWDVTDTGKNYAWNGTAWDDLGGIIDLSDYFTKTEVAAMVDSKVDKVPGKQLSTNDYDNAEKQKVADNTTARHTHSNKAVLDAIVADGSGDNYLADDGTYKPIDSGGADSPYDLVIRTQEDFIDMITDGVGLTGDTTTDNANIQSSTWKGAKSVALVGEFTLDFSSNQGVKRPATVTRIDGYNNAKITVTNFSYDNSLQNGGLWDDRNTNNPKCYINDLTVDCTGSALNRGFNGDNNTYTNCTGNGSGTSGGYGFRGNNNTYTNCTGNGSGTSNGYGFFGYNNTYTNCTGNGTGGIGYGFFGYNNRIISCVALAYTASTPSDTNCVPIRNSSTFANLFMIIKNCKFPQIAKDGYNQGTIWCNIANNTTMKGSIKDNIYHSRFTDAIIKGEGVVATDNHQVDITTL